MKLDFYEYSLITQETSLETCNIGISFDKERWIVEDALVL